MAAPSRHFVRSSSRRRLQAHLGPLVLATTRRLRRRLSAATRAPARARRSSTAATRTASLRSRRRIGRHRRLDHHRRQAASAGGAARSGRHAAAPCTTRSSTATPRLCAAGRRQRRARSPCSTAPSSGNRVTAATGAASRRHRPQHLALLVDDQRQYRHCARRRRRRDRHAQLQNSTVAGQHGRRWRPATERAHRARATLWPTRSSVQWGRHVRRLDQRRPAEPRRATTSPTTARACSPGRRGHAGDPQLGALSNNGGPTDTMALGTGSPAINAGDPQRPARPDRPALARPRSAPATSAPSSSAASRPEPSRAAAGRG